LYVVKKNNKEEWKEETIIIGFEDKLAAVKVTFWLAG
jgi:hypothetical protein